LKDGQSQDQDEFKRLLNLAKDLIGNQKMYDLRLSENEKQLGGLFDKIAHKKQPNGKSDSDKEMEALLRQAKKVLEND
jgi:hypothetical protein